MLVVGCGSVGRRHAMNLAALGCTVSGVDPRSDRLEELLGAVECHSVGRELAPLFELLDLSAVVVASPPSVHVDQALAAIARRLPVLIEKPVAPDQAAAERLRDAAAHAGVPVLVGYTWRWARSVRRVGEHLDAGAIGRPLSARCVLSAHLADWHPWERYQDFFMARADQGGGALLDESHFLDLMLAWFGEPEAVRGEVARVSDLEIDSDDNVDVAWVAPSGVRVSVHLDLYGRPHDRHIIVAGTEGTLAWTPNLVRRGFNTDTWEEEPFTDDRNVMFEAVASELLAVLDGGSPSCTLDDGVSVLRVVEAVRRSSSSGASEALR